MRILCIASIFCLFAAAVFSQGQGPVDTEALKQQQLGSEEQDKVRQADNIMELVKEWKSEDDKGTMEICICECFSEIDCGERPADSETAKLLDWAKCTNSWMQNCKNKCVEKMKSKLTK